MGRRRTDNTLSLFAFQDIITGVAGVMLFILLLLVVQLAIPAVQTAARQPQPTPRFPTASRADRERLETMRRQLAEMRERTEARLSVQSMRPDAVIEQLRTDLQSETDEQARLRQRSERLRERMRRERVSEKVAELTLDVDTMEREAGRADEQLERLEKGDFISFRAADSMPNLWMVDLRRTSAELVHLRSPERSRTIEFPESIQPDQLARRLDTELRRDQAGRSIVVLLRPSSAGRGSELLTQLRTLRYQIALELLDSETKVTQ